MQRLGRTMKILLHVVAQLELPGPIRLNPKGHLGQKHNPVTSLYEGQGHRNVESHCEQGDA